ncbi:MAG: phage/plasmid replication protein, II/X family [Rhodocyclales bacterium]|nr:phage/plasmid replication protein, II/X family [Rhodocyclales bacterium]
MFDTVKAYFQMTALVSDSLTDDKALERLGIKLYGNKFFLPHPFGYDNPAVYFDLDEREFWIETSIPKLLQGHNVFGSNRLQYLCLAVARLIYHHLGLLFTRRERQQIEDRRIGLGRADTTCSFRMASLGEVAATVESCWEQLRAEGREWATEGIDDFESVYNQKHSKRVAEKFYAKYVELMVKRHRIPDCVAQRELVLEYAKYLVRFEVTWRAPELRRLGLAYADQWTPQIVRQKIMERMDRLNLQGAIRERLAPKHLDNLNKGDLAFYDLWAQGSNLRPHRHYSPLKRARQNLLKHGVDIFRRPATGNDIALNELLTEENAYFVGPKALTRRGAIFGF